MPVVILIIAFGGALVVFSIILIVVLREVKENSGRVWRCLFLRRDFCVHISLLLLGVIQSYAFRGHHA